MGHTLKKTALDACYISGPKRKLLEGENCEENLGLALLCSDVPVHSTQMNLRNKCDLRLRGRLSTWLKHQRLGRQLEGQEP